MIFPNNFNSSFSSLVVVPSFRVSSSSSFYPLLLIYSLFVASLGFQSLVALALSLPLGFHWEDQQPSVRRNTSDRSSSRENPHQHYGAEHQQLRVAPSRCQIRADRRKSSNRQLYWDAGRLEHLDGSFQSATLRCRIRSM